MFFMYFIMRAGIQVLADHPRLYWNRDCTPGTECTRPHRRATARNGLPTHGGPSLILQSSRSMCRMAKKPEPPPTWNRLQDCR
jgi:hypothetical protein